MAACDGTAQTDRLLDDIEEVEEDIEDPRPDQRGGGVSRTGTGKEKHRQTVETHNDERAGLVTSQKKIQGTLSELVAHFPSGREIAPLLKGVSETANREGLEVRRFEAMAEIPRSDLFVAEVPVNIELYGDYHTVARFFDELSRLPRIVSVKDISIGDSETNGRDSMVTMTGQLVTYRMLTSEEILRFSADSKGGSSPIASRSGSTFSQRAKKSHELGDDHDSNASRDVLQSMNVETSVQPKSSVLQRYELNEYVLVGAGAVSERFALVRDPTGDEHVVEIGDYIGTNWAQVSAIDRDSIVLEEKLQRNDGDRLVIERRLNVSGAMDR